VRLDARADGDVAALAAGASRRSSSAVSRPGC